MSKIHMNLSYILSQGKGYMSLGCTQSQGQPTFANIWIIMVEDGWSQANPVLVTTLRSSLKAHPKNNPCCGGTEVTRLLFFKKFSCKLPEFSSHSFIHGQCSDRHGSMYLQRVWGQVWRWLRERQWCVCVCVCVCASTLWLAAVLFRMIEYLSFLEGWI